MKNHFFKQVVHIKPIQALLAIFIFTMLLTGCSSDKSDDPSGAQLASINLGPDITVLEGQSFALTAAIYPEEGAVIWRQIQGPAFEIFPEEAATQVTLTAPSINIDTTIILEVTYTTLDGQRVRDQINIFVTNINEEPIARIADQTESVSPYRTFEVVTLSADDSFDPDGEIRYYKWRQIDNNAPLQLLSADNLSELTFQAPFVTQITNYIIQLTVTDNYGLASTNTIDVQIAAAEGTVATEAGQDQIVDEFTRVILDASDSVSVDDVLSCQWQQLTGVPVTLTNSDQCIAEFFAPNVDSTELLTFEVTVVDNGNNSQSDTINITVNPLNLGSLHDTGVIDCYNNIDKTVCNNVDFPNQVADSGRDSVRDAIDKSGKGEKTFDFTKFDVNGDEVHNDSLVFSCVRDNFTGLVWEVKVGNANPKFSELRGVENHYSIDDSQTPSTCAHPTSCGIESYVDNVNQEAYCGGANWRLPTYLELIQILDYGNIDKVNLFPSEFFPNSPDVAALNHLFYWVSDLNMEGGGESFNWVIDVRNGDDSAIKPNAAAYVRLVRTP